MGRFDCKCTPVDPSNKASPIKGNPLIMSPSYCCLLLFLFSLILPSTRIYIIVQFSISILFIFYFFSQGLDLYSVNVFFTLNFQMYILPSCECDYIQIYHVWEGYLRKIPVKKWKISQAEWWKSWKN